MIFITLNVGCCILARGRVHFMIMYKPGSRRAPESVGKRREILGQSRIKFGKPGDLYCILFLVLNFWRVYVTIPLNVMSSDISLNVFLH